MWLKLDNSLNSRVAVVADVRHVWLVSYAVAARKVRLISLINAQIVLTDMNFFSSRVVRLLVLTRHPYHAYDDHHLVTHYLLSGTERTKRPRFTRQAL
jgi:hypothetical protein